ncbi:Calcium/calmodulin-dependent protein kinase kinase-like protein [Emericellopsis cladophorae]|uniref:Calcium/calmodulin-dependent protein kinase kinase-like protein n=1 Tax=Emericellopsis cladophorae TaxID=2686198 RepID=A0A9Q0BH69_9HYPO|nr:Calcium/calmodulin-dependent protein kinase kinase-like protein [Emericellopsis cladophorae]KAI6785762.1 Calcium/calmodulin-dependent protein kinase kinase-like protein [Emericellopsis cladophorae]
MVSIDNHDDPITATRPAIAPHVSDPPGVQHFASPLRHHKRKPSTHHEVKETLDAHVEFMSDETDGRTHHRINQYVIQDEIGRGSFGSVHLGTDQFGTEYAIKEFSKVRLRKRAQSNILKQGPHRPLRRSGLDAPLTPWSSGGSARAGEKDDALYLIREEIAIMKKLNHPNLVQLIEVLDDPEEDSLYMVMEMCKKGVVMKVGLDKDATPYDEEACRHMFRDLVLGIEYLHAQGVIHRDIKPDNLLLSEDDVLKVVDFGVSQMFERSSEMRTAKSAGSPAFLPPELCGKHSEVSGKAADIWSMGVSLFCLKYGRIPFNRDGMLAMYEAIKSDEPRIPEDESPLLIDLFRRILEKDPEKRIAMPELRAHPWVTKEGADPLLSAEENCAHHVDPPNELELNHAFTRKMNHLMCVMKVLQRFKALSARRRARVHGISSSSAVRMQSDGESFDAAAEKERAEEIEALMEKRRRVQATEKDAAEERAGASDADKPQAHDVGDQEPLFLGIGTGSRDDFAMDEATPNIVADSPTAVDFDVYDQAYLNAVQERLNATTQGKPTLYLTRFVRNKENVQKLGALIDGTGLPTPSTSKLADLVSKMGVSSSGVKSEANPSSSA